jgi:1-deoxy-D-xylulose-5-phosphate reductoisomerase
MTKRVAILGSTGSIGANTLRVIDALGADYSVAALSAHNNVELLADQALRFRPPVVAITNPEKESQLRSLLTDYTGTILSGPDSLTDIASASDVDIVVTALVGAAGLPAVLAAAKMGKRLAIANKEPLVIAGRLLSETAKQNNAAIIPIDSEHSAIFQALQAGAPEEVDRIILTASGGPFRTADPRQMHNAAAAEALAHPTWNMGPKITVDSATMVNKALEVIEAVWLFDMPVDKIHVLIHPESVVHSMVEFVDGSVVAQLGTPDMCVPIQYALTYPKRRKGIATRLSLEKLGTLTFEKPDMKKFKALKIGFDVAKTGGSAPVVFNAANEAAVAEFLAGRIALGRIVELIADALGKHNLLPSVSLDELLAADRWARQYVHKTVTGQKP